jgi:hypothetical protein
MEPTGTERTGHEEDGPRKPLLGRTATVLLALFGAALPLATLGIELATAWCSELLFDPIPSPGHIILVALVPVANLAVIAALRRQKSGCLRHLGWLNGVAIGVAGLYALVFLPFMPAAFIGIIFFGAGLLPLSPALALVCGIVLRVKLGHMARQVRLPRLPGLWVSIVSVVLLLAAMELPKVLTFVGMRMAVSEDQVEESRGIRLLRACGSNEILLRTCYVRSSNLFGDPVATLFNMAGRPVVSEGQARTIYYRVTGTPFNAVKPPRIHAWRGDFLMDDFDFNVGGDQVQGRLRGLSLDDSRIDAVVDPVACTAYTEWTMTFRNASFQQQEARTQVLLPPGAVVSRLTLWIDGQEREAAFGSRSQVREAYTKVVSRRRDPVLVTTSGPDQVLVQCFPVPPNGGTMKIRIGMTAPLDLDSLSQGRIRLPFFVERNFSLPDKLSHPVWIESRAALASTAQGFVEERRGDAFALRGNLKNGDMERPVSVSVTRDASATETRASDTRGAEPASVTQTIAQRNGVAPDRAIVVVDGSRRMKAYTEDVADVIQSLPDGIEFAVLQASDAVLELTPMRKADGASRKLALAALRNAEFSGGCNNATAIGRAWDTAAASTNSVIIWLHATQPVDLGGMEGLLQRWDRVPDGPRLLSAQFDTGPDLVSQNLTGRGSVRRLARSDSVRDDVKRELSTWTGKTAVFTFDRIRSAGAAPTAQGGSLHVVRLWANDEVRRLAASRRDADRQQAVALATRYQLVTPVSGAVVLETQQQYQEAGLEPVPASSVPSVPEPELWMLLAVAVFVAFVMARRWRPRAA